ncbi:hypothetical protein NST69_21075 [Paenibacillus sp. FSL P2-0089]
MHIRSFSAAFTISQSPMNIIAVSLIQEFAYCHIVAVAENVVV